MAPPRKKGKALGKVVGKAVQVLVQAFPASSNGFPALPLDILFEIFSHLHPIDLLYLTRTTKPFRRFLLNRANVAIWRAAFENSSREGGPPGCPSYMTEPAWARVAFEKTCHVCSAALRDNREVDSVWWEFGARYCGDCLRSQICNTISPKLKRLDPNRPKFEWDSLFPRVLRYYLVAHQREMMDAFIETEDPELRAAFVERRVEQTRLVMQHSKLCREWAQLQIQNRAELRRQAAEDRRQKKELKEKAEKEARLEAIIPSVDVAKPLTPRDYRELEPALLLRLNAGKRASVLKQRLSVFLKSFPLIIDQADLNNIALSIRPCLVDILLIPAVRALLEEDGHAAVSPEHLVSTLRPLMPELLQTWAGEAEAQIADHARKLLDLRGETASVDQPDTPALAIAYFTCPRNCGAAGYFPKLYKHSCTAPNSLWLYRYYSSYGENNPEAYESLAEQCTAEKPFTPTVLHFGVRLHALEGVVKVYGRDPMTATFKEMAGDRRLVSCTVYNASKPMDWLAAMEHGTKFHLRERDPEIAWKFSGGQRDSDIDV
ncbi:hypothetical protein DFH09DRAFT_1133806 [Mycena vulgaris]|nr:hypothetical protein DFH09DRAFT_1133806 [Mycena vulgaris]